MNFKLIFVFFWLKEKEQAQKLYKGKKLKTSDKPKTFIPGEQLDKLTLNQANNGFGQEQQQRQAQSQRVQPTKEDIEAIKVNLFLEKY